MGRFSIDTIRTGNNRNYFKPFLVLFCLQLYNSAKLPLHHQHEMFLWKCFSIPVAHPQKRELIPDRWDVEYS